MIRRFIILAFIATACILNAPVWGCRGDGDKEWLCSQTMRILNGSKTLAEDNFLTLFTPDASGHYVSQYTRDFYYALSGTPASYWNETAAVEAVKYIYDRQRADGCMPDRVRTDGRADYSPGPINSPISDHAWDNGPFAALLLAEVVQKWPGTSDLFCKLEPQAQRAIEFLALKDGLVYNDPIFPNATYGFTDNIAKTGSLLFTSLLLFDSSMVLSKASLLHNCGNATFYANAASNVNKTLDDILYDDASGIWLAASEDNNLPDIWGSLYAIALGSTNERRERALRILFSPNETINCACCTRSVRDIYSFGQIRHLPAGCYWSRCLFGATEYYNCSTSVPRGTYQNGGFWATPIQYAARASLALPVSWTAQRAFAADLLNQTITFFKEGFPGMLSPQQSTKP